MELERVFLEEFVVELYMNERIHSLGGLRLVYYYNWSESIEVK